MKTIRQTKVRPPAVRGDLVTRTRLLDHLDAGLNAGLILVCAPAGYGKTTLVLQWAARRPEALAWVDLDASDDDVGLFVGYLAAAVLAATGQELTGLERIVGAGHASPTDEVASELIDALELLTADVILVLEDSHCLRSERVWQLVAALARRPPRHLKLVLEARRDPPLALPRLRARAELVEVRERDLRFTRDEARAFFAARLGAGLEVPELDNLFVRTEGWPAGLQLAALSLGSSDDPTAAARRFTGSDRYIMDYLLDEIFDKLSTEERERLLRTSVVDSFNPSLFSALLADGSAAGETEEQFLGWLSATPFVVALTEQPGWYRYHRLFQDLLHDRLLVTHGAAVVRDLHARAATWFSERGYAQEALRQAEDAGDEGLLARIVEERYAAAIESGRWQDLERWLRALPPDLIGRRPRLLLCRAQILERQHRLVELSEALDAVEDLLIDDPQGVVAADVRQVQSEVDALRAATLYWAGDADGSALRARRSLEWRAGVPTRSRGMALVYLSGALDMAGDRAGAVRILQNGLSQDTPDSAGFPSLLLVGLWVLHTAAGDMAGAAQAADRLLELARDRGLMDSRAWGHLLLGLVAYERDELEAAEEHVQQVVDLRFSSHLQAAKQGFMGLALARQARGEHEAADRAADELKGYLLAHGDRASILEADSFRARLRLQRGEAPYADVWAAAVDSEAVFANLGAASTEVPHLTFAWTLVAGREEPGLAEAESLLGRLEAAAVRFHHVPRIVQVRCLQALLLEARGEAAAAVERMSSAVSLARSAGLVRTIADFGPVAAALLERLAVASPDDRGLAAIVRAATRAPGAERPVTHVERADMDLLTNREMDVLMLLAQRLSNKEIAGRLFISPLTVKRHTVNIYSKLDAANRREAARKAVELGLLPAG